MPATPRLAETPSHAGRLAIYDALFKGLCQAAAALVVLVAALLVLVLVTQSWLAISTYGVRFLAQTQWAPNARVPVFGSLAFVYGTVVTSLIAMLIAVPLGVGTAAYLSEIASPGVRKVAAFFIEMLAAIPSVIYGFWGYMVLTPLLGSAFRWAGSDNPSGRGLLAAGLVLAVMIVPYIAAITYDVCQAVPRSQREGAFALGATRWQTIWGVVLPYARPGIVAGAFLALGRALGETMAVTMLIGNVSKIDNPITGLGDSIASKLANQFMEADTRLFRSVLVELGLLLMLVTLVINILARVLLARVGEQKPVFPPLAWLMGLFRRPAARPVPVPGAPLPPHQPLRPSNKGLLSAQNINSLMSAVLGACVAFTMAMLVIILSYLMWKGAGALNWNFFTELPVGPTVRRGTALTGALNLPMTLPTLRERLAGPDAPPGLEVGPSAWADSTRRAEEKGEGPPTQASFDVYSTALDAPGVRRFVESRLGNDLAEVVEVEQSSGGGLANAIRGTLIIVGLATLFATPIGLLVAIYLSEYRPGPLAYSVRFIAEQLGSVPSIVVGIFAAGLFEVTANTWGGWFGVRPRLYGWSAVFALAVMMIPIVLRASEEALKLVPQSLRTASYALGGSQAQTILRVVLPAALPAIITAIFLSVARIAGETAPLLLTSGFNTYWPGSLGDFTATLPPYIYLFATSPSENWKDQAWAGAFVLMALVLLLNFGIRWVTGKRLVQASHAD